MRLSTHLLRRPTFWAALLTFLYLIGLATRVSPYLLGPAEWQWHSRPPALSTIPRWWPALLLLTAYGVIAVLWIDGRAADCPSRRREWAVLAFLGLAAPAIQIALKYIHYRYPLEFYLYRTIGPHNGFWQVASGIDDLGYYLRTYPEQMLTYPFVHTPVHPPGNIVYIWLWRWAMERLPGLTHPVAQLFRSYNCADLQFVRLNDAQIASALAQMAIPLLSGLVVVPIYLLGKRLAGPRTGFRAAALAVVIPSFALFTMRWDQLYPLFLCCALYWLHVGLEKHKPALFFLAGLAVSVASFMSFGNATFLPALAAYGLAHMAAAPANWRLWLRQTWAGWALLALGVISVWLIYQAAFDISFWDVFSTAMSTHFNLGRTYWVWLFYNPYDFMTFLGVALAVLFVAGCVQGWEKVIHRRDHIPGIALLALALSFTLLALNLSGVARGEVGRMWLPWMLPAALVAAAVLDHRRTFALLLSLTALQALFFTLFLRVSATGMPSFQPHQPATNIPTIANPLPAQVGDDIALLGFAVEPAEVRAGETLRLTLYWQALAQPDQPYTVFTHLTDEAGQLRGQQDNMPVRGSLPTTCWQPGEVIADPYEIVVDAEAPPGDYVLQVGMYDLWTGERLAVRGAPDQPPDRLLLAVVRVVTP